jgi:hypothetical protein
MTTRTAWPLALLLSLLLLLPRAAFAADDALRPECDPAAALNNMNGDAEKATQIMLRTDEAMLQRLGCNINEDVMKEIRKTPEAFEIILTEKDPACHDKMFDLYHLDTKENRETLQQVVADVLDTYLQDLGCPRDREKIESLIALDFRLRDLGKNYTSCLMALQRIASAERMYKSGHSEYTSDFGDLLPLLVTSINPDETKPDPEIAKYCCGAAGCDPKKNSEAWTPSFGLELSDDGNFEIYGYPIGGPDCLIMVTPAGSDPDTFDACYAESEENKTEK